jgi:hypothetical protein
MTSSPRTLATAVLVGLTLAGCGTAGEHDDGLKPDPARQTGVDGQPGAGAAALAGAYLVKDGTNHLVPVAVPSESGTHAGPDAAKNALEGLLGIEPKQGAELQSLWDDFCAPGQGVTSVTATRKLVTVKLSGDAAALCDLSMEGWNLQRQQFAWTVMDNLDGFDGLAADTPVRLLGPSGVRMWDDVVAKPRYVEQVQPTPSTTAGSGTESSSHGTDAQSAAQSAEVTDASVRVPEVAQGATAAEARRILRAAGLAVHVERGPCDWGYCQMGGVGGTSPKAGAVVAAGSPVTLYVS